MSAEWGRLTADEAAAATQLDVGVVWHYAEVGLILPSAEGYTDGNLAELRRVRRLRMDLELDHPAIEIVLRLRHRIEVMQAEIRRLELAAGQTRASPRQFDWLEGDWEDLF